MYSYGHLHMAEQKQDDQLAHTYSSSVRMRDVAQKTCQRPWTIVRSGEGGSGISALAARFDNDDIYTHKHIYNNMYIQSPELREEPNLKGGKVWTIERHENCLDAPSRSKSLRQGRRCRLMYYPGGNTTDLIWIGLDSSDGIS